MVYMKWLFFIWNFMFNIIDVLMFYYFEENFLKFCIVNGVKICLFNFEGFIN